MSRPSPQTDRVVAVVEMLASTPGGLNQSEIARRLGVTPATCYPALATLERAGWLRRHPTRRTYALGPALIAAGHAAAAGVDALAACRPRMVDLQRRLRLSVLALVPAADYATVAHIALDPRGPASALRVGDQIPFHPPLGATSTAWRSEAAVDRWLDRGGVTEPVSRQQCRDILAFIRQRGYAVELATSLDDRVRRHLVDLVRARPDLGGGQSDGRAPTGRPASSEALGPLLRELADGLTTATDLVAASLEPGLTYRVESLSAPVFDGHGDVAVVLTLRGFGGQTPAAEVERLGAALTAATASVTADIAGRQPHP